MNILYLHGLDSSLNEEKRTILERFGTVFAPPIDYRNNPDTITQLYKKYKNHDPLIGVVIGSSMGGFAGYYLADALQRPALLFNPALAQRSVKQEVMELPNPKLSLKHIVLGAKDDVIDPAKTLQFLSKTLATNTEYNIRLRQDLAHRIPVTVFEESIKDFFRILS
ncbi:MAG: alpha/beta hydrolase [Flavobacteriaceae bacterium]|nr:alpha/beta hydrolase [Flavobacteriaceae bacterium]